MILIRKIIFTLIIFSLFGCKKDTNILPAKVVEGTVFEDCMGHVSKGTKIYLQLRWTGCFGNGIILKDSTVTDDYGHFIIHYNESKQDPSLGSYYYYLIIPNSSIRIYNPDGNYNLYPNGSKMNAVIHLKFYNIYSSSDTFYYQFKPTYDGFIHEPEFVRFFVGPFHDTTLVLYNLTVGNVNDNDLGKSCSGIFKWGIGIKSLNYYYSGRDGYFDLTHKPCIQADTFEYDVNPI